MSVLMKRGLSERAKTGIIVLLLLIIVIILLQGYISNYLENRQLEKVSYLAKTYNLAENQEQKDIIFEKISELDDSSGIQPNSTEAFRLSHRNICAILGAALAEQLHGLAYGTEQMHINQDAAEKIATAMADAGCGTYF